jgi:RNA polymerase sigma factor (sigma-70 family)
MENALSAAPSPVEQRTEQNRGIVETVERERGRLFRFIRQRVDDQGDAEDILQDVFHELTEAYRLMTPIEQAGAWLYRVARNRIIDRFRRKKPELFSEIEADSTEENAPRFEDLLPSPEAGPDAAYARTVLLEELEDALAELPEEQRAVFIANEIEGRGFRELAEETGLNINTLISRKRYAVLHLRRRLRAIHEEFGS